MRKSRVIAVVVSGVLVLAAAGAGVWYYLAQQQEQEQAALAEAAQQTAYDEYTALMENIQSSTLTVTENGKTIGIYNLDQLGLRDQAISDAKNCFGEWDRMEPELFASLGEKEKIDWQNQAKRRDPIVTLDTTQLDTSRVLLDLNKEIRVAPQNAYAHLVDGAYVIEPETAGTQLDSDIVSQALQSSLTAKTIDDQAPLLMEFSVSDCDAYEKPEITLENASFDYDALLQQDTEGVQIPVLMLDQTVPLDVAGLVSLDSDGKLQVNQDSVTQIVAGWAETYRRKNSDFIFDSYLMGPIALDFVHCDYELDQQTLISQLIGQLEVLDTTEVEAPFTCTRNGEPFSIEGTYVEVDITNQQMMYFKDGQLLVQTDVVTGLSWAYATPTGLYAVQNKETDDWLTGPDYRVFIKYWVGFNGAYGLHDASWRTKFGGDNYINNGSHGCVNTPEEAMKQIYDNIEVGTPVVVHKVKKAES